MLKLKTKWFSKWSKKNTIKDKKLLRAMDSISDNLGSVDLGGGLYKARIPREQEGKSGGFRSIVVYRESDKAIFVYGFSKNEKDNLDKEELKYFKKLAKDLFEIDIEEYIKLIKLGEFINIEE